ncbi:MAG: VWA-like domain-containing protein [Pseudomonadota bacterium]|nr:VWA-like domain-containing protein [Pseudomonadota bacterium]MDP1905508.1 VWA-like domain-containing protein [Pseudomonadota bacterium]
MSKAMEAVSAARRNLVLDQPFFGVLSLRLDLVEDKTVRTLETDGRKLWFNPEYVATLSKHELQGVVAHEVLHCANGHVWRMENRSGKLWNNACDYVVNQIVLDAGMMLPQGALDGTPYKGMSAEEVYEHLNLQPPSSQQPESTPDEEEGGSGDENETGAGQPQQQDDAEDGDGTDSQPGPGPGNGEGDDEGDGDGQDGDGSQENSGSGDGGQGESQGNNQPPPDGSECGQIRPCADDAQPELQADWSAAVLNAAKRAESMGRLPAGLERLMEDIKNPPQDWRAILRRFVQQNATSDYSWRQPNTRYMYAGLYMPALRSESMPPMVVAVDTSGSIDDLTLNQFTREIDSIVGDLQPEMVYVVYCDAEIHGVDTFERGEPITLNPKGFCGTDFRPVFDWVEEEGLQPSCLVYLTDLYGDFPPNPPAYPVMWGATSDYIPPWGESVRVRCY